jgi:hypothetical protein
VKVLHGAPVGKPRFEVLGPFSNIAGSYVRDNYTRLPGTSNWRPISKSYTSREEAQAVADWLTERAAGYPMRPLDWPVSAYGMPHGGGGDL